MASAGSTVHDTYQATLDQSDLLTLQQLSDLLLAIRDNAGLGQDERHGLLQTVDALVWKRAREKG